LRAVIISGGAISDYSYIKSQIKLADTIICADSGYEHAKKMGLTASVVVGDFDSIGNIPKDVECIHYPAKKDLTDTEIAIEYARTRGFTDFLMLGATGSRADHSLTNIFLLKSFLQRGENAEILDENNKIKITNSRISLNEPPGTIVSLVPLCDCQGVSTQNLEYHLQNEDMPMGRGRGVSNIMTENNATITLTNGILLVMVTRD